MLLIAVFLVSPLLSCGDQNTDVGTPDNSEIKINDTALADYVIVYADEELDFGLNAAEYVRDEIKEETGLELAVKLDTEAEETECEILIGLTNRAASAEAAKTELGGYEFIVAAKDKKIILYGEEYMVAGAAYNFIDKNVANSSGANVTLSAEFTPKSPEYKTPENFILLIGDGMGFNSLEFGEDMYEEGKRLMLEDTMSYTQYKVADRLPYKAQSHTRSADAEPVTDSAAGGTALATGYKTYNGVVGLNDSLEEVKNLSELAIELGKMTAVLTTDTRDGATPASFSAHTDGRGESDDIRTQQESSAIDLIVGDIRNPAVAIRDALDEIGDAENGFFMMFEEAHIDKASHNNDADSMYVAYTRLNTELRVFSEFIMYNPDTVLILTADHETGGITWNEEKGAYNYTTGSHTGACVPFYAIGEGVSHIDGKKYDNTYIPKLIASLMGEDNFGDPEREEETDKTGLEELSAKELIAIAKKMNEADKAYTSKKNAEKKAALELKQALREAWGLAN